MKKTINVESHHIFLGNRCSPSSCPIALAIKEQVKDISNIMVEGGILEYKSPKYFAAQWVYLPKIAKDFVNSYDACQEVKCISFDLEIL